MGRLTPDVRDHPDDVLRRAERLLESYGVYTATPLEQQASNQYLVNEIEGLRTFAIILPGVFLAVAALVLNVLIMRLARQQRVVIGTLKALGYTDGQVVSHLVQFGTGVGLAGGLVGCLLGYWLAEGMTQLYQQYFEFPDLYNGVYPYLYAVAVAVSLLWRWQAACTGACDVAAETGRGHASRASGARRPHPAGACRLAVAAAERRVAHGAARCVSQPCTFHRGPVCRHDGNEPDGDRIPDERVDELPAGVRVLSCHAQ